MAAGPTNAHIQSLSFKRIAHSTLIGIVIVLGISAVANGQNNMCFDLESRLANLQSGDLAQRNNPQARQLERTATEKRNELAKLQRAARRAGCRTNGIRIFQNRQCARFSRSISGLQRDIRNLQERRSRISGGSKRDIERQKRELVLALGRAGCGAQYERITRQFDQGRETIFGRRRMNDLFDRYGEPIAAGYTTVCVRVCDGYFFPISFAATSSEFRKDERVCKSKFPNADVELYYFQKRAGYTYDAQGFPVPSLDDNDAIRRARSLDGRAYVEMPFAFSYRENYDASCTFNRIGLEITSAELQEQQKGILRAPAVNTPIRAETVHADLRFGAAGPIPLPRPIIGLDPETAMNSAGSFEPKPQAMPAWFINDPMVRDGQKIRRVGPEFVYGQSMAEALTYQGPNLVQ